MNAGSVSDAHTELTHWVVRAQQEDSHAFEQVMERTMGLVRKTAFPLVRPHQVDDVVQEAFLTVFKKLHHLQKPEAFQAWLSRIVIHTCHKIRKQAIASGEIPEQISPNDEAHQVATRLDLRSALNQLKEEERQVLILREFVKFSYEDIAYVTRLPLGTVRSRIHYARKKLQKLLEG